MHRLIQRLRLVLAAALLPASVAGLWAQSSETSDPLLQRNPFVPPGWGETAPPPPPPVVAQPPTPPLTVAFTGVYTNSKGEFRFTLFNTASNEGKTVKQGDNAFGVTIMNYVADGGEAGRPALSVMYGGRRQTLSMRDTSGQTLAVASAPAPGANNPNANLPAQLRNIQGAQGRAAQTRSRVTSLNPRATTATNNASAGNNQNANEVPRPRVRRRTVVIPPRQ